MPFSPFYCLWLQVRGEPPSSCEILRGSFFVQKPFSFPYFFRSSASRFCSRSAQKSTAFFTVRHSSNLSPCPVILPPTRRSTPPQGAYRSGCPAAPLPLPRNRQKNMSLSQLSEGRPKQGRQAGWWKSYQERHRSFGLGQGNAQAHDAGAGLAARKHNLLQAVREWPHPHNLEASAGLHWKHTHAVLR